MYTVLFFYVSDSLDPVIDTLDKSVVEWKFSQYDKDFDNQLSLREVKSLRRLVKKFIKPRACAKTFLKYCDSDHNKFIERGEWSLCLGVDITSEYMLTFSSSIILLAYLEKTNHIVFLNKWH